MLERKYEQAYKSPGNRNQHGICAVLSRFSPQYTTLTAKRLYNPIYPTRLVDAARIEKSTHRGYKCPCCLSCLCREGGATFRRRRGWKPACLESCTSIPTTTTAATGSLADDDGTPLNLAGCDVDVDAAHCSRA
jgi:hypothetical protein